MRHKASRRKSGKKEVIKMEREQQSENSLHTIAIILLCCGAIKMLHLMGVIAVEGESRSTSTVSIIQHQPNQQSGLGRGCVFTAVSRLLERKKISVV